MAAECEENQPHSELNRYCPTTEWHNPSNFFPIHDDWETASEEEEEDLECSIGRQVNEEDGHMKMEVNTLSELFGVEDKRAPEDDNFDLGLGLESPDIQRWAEETGWSEVTDKIEELDYGWGEAAQPAPQPTFPQRGRSSRTSKPKAHLSSIQKVGRGFDLELHDVDALKSRWPISLHWSIEDASFSKATLKETEYCDE